MGTPAQVALVNKSVAANALGRWGRPLLALGGASLERRHQASAHHNQDHGQGREPEAIPVCKLGLGNRQQLDRERQSKTQDRGAYRGPYRVSHLTGGFQHSRGKCPAFRQSIHHHGVIGGIEQVGADVRR